MNKRKQTQCTALEIRFRPKNAMNAVVEGENAGASHLTPSLRLSAPGTAAVAPAAARQAGERCRRHPTVCVAEAWRVRQRRPPPLHVRQYYCASAAARRRPVPRSLPLSPVTGEEAVQGVQVPRCRCGRQRHCACTHTRRWTVRSGAPLQGEIGEHDARPSGAREHVAAEQAVTCKNRAGERAATQKKHRNT